MTFATEEIVERTVREVLVRLARPSLLPVDEVDVFGPPEGWASRTANLLCDKYGSRAREVLGLVKAMADQAPRMALVFRASGLLAQPEVALALAAAALREHERQPEMMLALAAAAVKDLFGPR